LRKIGGALVFGVSDSPTKVVGLSQWAKVTKSNKCNNSERIKRMVSN
jgi:hypothetical protein